MTDETPEPEINEMWDDLHALHSRVIELAEKDHPYPPRAEMWLETAANDVGKAVDEAAAAGTEETRSGWE